MNGLMMDYPLTLSHILERSAKIYPGKEIAGRLHDGSMHRYSYAEFHRRVHRLAHVLQSLDLQPGDRIGTLCWNSSRHLELYFAIPCAGYVLHTLNLRLAADQLFYIVNHAEDRVIFVDASLLPLLDQIRAELKSVQQIVVLNDAACELPLGSLDFEKLLEEASDDPFTWPALDENAAAAMCYTSGTTGHPKGVVYSHRALFLHSYGLCMADTSALSERDTILQVIPMFHANGWGFPYAGIMTGSRLVLSGRQLQPADIAMLIENERVTFSSGVPTVWMGLHGCLDEHPCDVSSLRMILVAGSAMPPQFVESYQKKYGVHIMLGWGMTELTPIGTVTSLKSHLTELPEHERFGIMARHGIPVAG